MSLVGSVSTFAAICISVAFILGALTVFLMARRKTSGFRGSKEDSNPDRRLRIAVDMDEVIADALPHHLSLYNKETGEHVTPEDIRKHGKSVIKFRDVFNRIPHQPGFFANLAVIKGSQEALQLLCEQFDVFITSAAMDVPFSFDDKFRWLQEHFPFIPAQRIVFCGNKEIINADYLVDDRSRHFPNFRGTGILFTAPHNAKEDVQPRANNWDEVLEILGVAQRDRDTSSRPSLVGAEDLA